MQGPVCFPWGGVWGRVSPHERLALTQSRLWSVLAGWLMLQAPRWELQEGEPLRLRCHSWKNVAVQKVQYFQDGRGRQFSYVNTEFRVQYAEPRHSGSYFCRGIIGKQNISSEAVIVTVHGEQARAPCHPIVPQAPSHRA